MVWGERLVTYAELDTTSSTLAGALFRRGAAAGCKFTFGTNNTGPNDLGRSEYGLKMIDECKLGWQDFFVPGAWWPKATDRKGDLLKA